MSTSGALQHASTQSSFFTNSSYVSTVRTDSSGSLSDINRLPAPLEKVHISRAHWDSPQLESNSNHLSNIKPHIFGQQISFHGPHHVTMKKVCLVLLPLLLVIAVGTTVGVKRRLGKQNHQM